MFLKVNLIQKILYLLTWLFFTLFSLLSPQILLAADENTASSNPEELYSKECADNPTATAAIVAALKQDDNIHAIEKLDLDANLLLQIVATQHYQNQAGYQVWIDFFNRDRLINLALERGADPNYLISEIFPLDQVDYYVAHPDQVQPEQIEKLVLFNKIGNIGLLLKNNFKKMDQGLYFKMRRLANRCGWFNNRDNKLYYWINDFLVDAVDHWEEKVIFVNEKKHKNLAINVTSTLKIPRTLHHIWLTNAVQKREIAEEDIKNLLLTKELFSHAASGEKWEQIVWTNDKSLIPHSVETLESTGIKVREISEVTNHLKLSKEVKKLIEYGLWGMASDTLRYDLINYFGGVYADLNYVFARNVEAEIYRYDFFVADDEIDYSHCENRCLRFENSLFGSKANHPVLNAVLSLVDRNLNHPPEYMRSYAMDIKSLTDAKTWEPFFFAYYKSANTEGNIDVVMSKDYNTIGTDVKKLSWFDNSGQLKNSRKFKLAINLWD